MANLKLTQVPVPSNGMNTVGQPGGEPTRTAPLVKNYLVHTPGRLQMRGPITQQPFPAVQIAEEDSYITGAWPFNDKLLIGLASHTGHIMPWVAPYQLSSSGELNQSKTHTVVVDLKGGEAEEVTNGGLAPGGVSARLGEWVYGYEHWKGEFSTVNGGAQSKRHLLKWSGNVSAGTQLTHGPVGAQYVKNYLNRLWVLGGISATAGGLQYIGTGTIHYEGGTGGIVINYRAVNPGNHELLEQGSFVKAGDIIHWNKAIGGESGSFEVGEVGRTGSGEEIDLNFIDAGEGIHASESVLVYRVLEDNGVEENTLFYSIENGPLSDEESNWKDPVSGLTNKIVVGQVDANDFGVALAQVNQTLVIFKRHSIWSLFGSSPETFQLRNLTQERGCIDPFSVCEVDGGVFFASQQGLEFFNGSEFRSIDDGIASVTQPLIQHYAGEEGIHDPSLSSGRVQIAYIDNGYLLVTITGQSPTDGSIVLPTFVGICHIASGNWAELSSDALQGVGDIVWAGRTAGTPYIFDGQYITAIPFVSNPETAIQTGLFLQDESITGKVAIPAEFWTDRIAFSTPAYKSQGHRFLLDYLFAGVEHGWEVELKADDSAQTVLDPTVVPAQEPATTWIFGRRFEQDFFTELMSGQLRVRNTQVGSITGADVYDATIEIHQSSQRRSV